MVLSKKILDKEFKGSDKGHALTYSTRYFDQEIPKNTIPAKGMPANAAYQLVHDELNMDGNPSLNLASFVTTWMEPQAEDIILQNLHKNFIDHDEYPQTAVIHERLVNMLARLFNSPAGCRSVGTSTVGSSEAIMLALLAHKWNWKKRREKEGRSAAQPNIVFGADVHVCWEKFARYFDVEARVVPMEKDCYTLTAKKVAEKIDENTICVGAIVGTTFTGQADPVEEINRLLLKVKKEKGWDIPMHVDGASGGWVAAFAYPELKWDFRLEQVKSINVSGHKYGLVYPGLGWLIFRDEADLPQDLIFYVNYLGGNMPTFTLNFSRGSSMILAQYYNFLRLGREGYRRIMLNVLDNARYLGERLAESGEFKMLNTARMLPIIALTLKAKERFTVFDLSDKLRERGWIISAYTLPANAESVSIMRIVVREHLSRDMAEILYADIMNACKKLRGAKIESKPLPRSKRGTHVC